MTDSIITSKPLLAATDEDRQGPHLWTPGQEGLIAMVGGGRGRWGAAGAIPTTRASRLSRASSSSRQIIPIDRHDLSRHTSTAGRNFELSGSTTQQHGIELILASVLYYPMQDI